MKTGRALLLLALATALPEAQAQIGKWPDKPVRVVVSFTPGGTADVVARMVAPRLSEEFGQQFIVDNRAGAGGAIGTEIVVRANPDGYTILVGASSYATNAALYKLPYDPITGIAPVTLITTGPFIVTVHPSVKAANLKEFIELVRAKPGSLTFGSSGTGTVPHLATELFLQMTNTHMVHVPYKGGAPAIVDLLGGQIQFFFGGPLVLSPHIHAGKLRGLAVTSEQRSSVMSGLERTMRKQRAAAEKIREDTATLHGLQDAASPDQTKINALADQLGWQTRIFEDRSKVVRFVCDVPNAIDQRLFALSRAIQQGMED